MKRGIRSQIGQFAIMPKWVLERSAEPGPIHLYATLAMHANRDTEQCYPTQETLAREMGCSVDSVSRYTKRLEDIGAIIIEKRTLPGGGWTNLYTVQQIQSGIRTTADQNHNHDNQSSVSPSFPLETSAQRVASGDRSFWDAAKRFHEAKPKERVARLIDLGYTLGFSRSGHAAAIVRRYGHGREIVRAALAYRENNGAGDPWEYMEVVLQRGVEKARQGNAWSGADRSGSEGALPVLTAAEAKELLRQEAVQAAGPGDGTKAPTGRAVRKGGGSRDSLQRSGRDDR